METKIKRCPGCDTELLKYTYEEEKTMISKLRDRIGIHYKEDEGMYRDDREALYVCENCGREYNHLIYQVPGDENGLGIKLVGAVFGDIIGSPYEFDANNIKTKEFPLISEESTFTDDTVMTLAVAEGLLNSIGGSDDEIKAALVESVKDWGRRYPYAGYGARFSIWLKLIDSTPYESFGNGAAMRCSAAGWLAESIFDARRLGRLTAEITHNHIEGIRSAEAVSAAIFLARKGADKDAIRRYIETEFGYDLSRTCDEIRTDYHHWEDAMRSVPEAITAFLEGRSFLDCIRTAVSLGGDSDTIAAIAGSIAEAYYGPCKDLKPIFEGLPQDMRDVIIRFNEYLR